MAEPVTAPLDPKLYPILVVDDEQDNLDAFRFNFRKVFDIVSAGSGPEALEVLKQKDVAVIITDQRMPKMTGLELLREAKELRPDAVGIIPVAEAIVPTVTATATAVADQGVADITKLVANVNGQVATADKAAQQAFAEGLAALAKFLPPAR